MGKIKSGRKDAPPLTPELLTKLREEREKKAAELQKQAVDDPNQGRAFFKVAERDLSKVPEGFRKIYGDLDPEVVKLGNEMFEYIRKQNQQQPGPTPPGSIEIKEIERDAAVQEKGGSESEKVPDERGEVHASGDTGTVPSGSSGSVDVPGGESEEKAPGLGSDSGAQTDQVQGPQVD